MEFVVIIIVVLGIGFALYTFLLSSTDVKDKHQRENAIYELKQQVISQNVKLQKLEFERAGISTETEKMKKELETAKTELEESRANETAMREDLQKMRLAEDNNKSGLDLLKAENESLKEKLMEKENENKRLSDEVKEFNAKLKTAAAEKHTKESKEPEIKAHNPGKNIPKNAGQDDKGDDIVKDVGPDQPKSL
jgi:chromosome segregation ATPase